MVIEYWLSNNAGGSVTANGIAGKVTIRQLAIFKNYIKCHSIWFFRSFFRLTIFNIASPHAIFLK
ncbi:hypothetical protein GYM21_002750 [Escherichia coli]|nr:hypothetical protein [Escherichia coli]